MFIPKVWALAQLESSCGEVLAGQEMGNWQLVTLTISAR